MIATRMVSYAGEAAVSGVSLINQLNAIFVIILQRWRPGAQWWSASTSAEKCITMPEKPPANACHSLRFFPY